MAPCVSSCCSSRGNYCCARQWLNRDRPRGKGGFKPYPKEAGLGFSWFDDGFWVARLACSHCQIWPLRQRTSLCPYSYGAFGWPDRVSNESTAKLNSAALLLILSEARAWGVWGGLCSLNQQIARGWAYASLHRTKQVLDPKAEARLGTGGVIVLTTTKSRRGNPLRAASLCCPACAPHLVPSGNGPGGFDVSRFSLDRRWQAPWVWPPWRRQWLWSEGFHHGRIPCMV